MFTRVSRNVVGLGVVLVVLSAVLWSTSGVFTRAVDTAEWTILFWRGLFSGLFICAYIAWRQGIGELSVLARLGKEGWALAVASAATTYFFVTAVKHTSIADVAVIYATVPFLAGLIGWLAMRERMTLKTVIASCAALAGVVIMFSAEAGKPSLFGDSLALLMSVTMGIKIVLIRKYPEAPMVAANVGGAALLLVGGLALSDPFALKADDFPYLVAFGATFAASVILLTEGARLIPAARTALISTLETPLAPMWAFLVFGEAPGMVTLAGGAIVLAALIWNMTDKHV